MNRSGRRLKMHLPNTIHHVMMRGNNRQNIFFGREYYEHFLQLLSEASKKYDHKILFFCLMTNHVHIVVRIHNATLSEIIKNISYRYVRWTHEKLNRIGHLFQGRYLSKEVKDERYLIRLCVYVHLNPVEAKMARSIDEYMWSSHRYYLFNNAPSWIDLSTTINVLKKKFNLTYREFIKEKLSDDKWRPTIHIDKQGNLVNNDTVNADYLVSMSQKNNEPIFLDLMDVTLIACNFLSVTVEELQSSSRIRELSRKRALVAYYGVKYANTTLAEISRLFCRTPAAINRIYSTIKMDPGKHFSKELLREIEAAFSEKQHQCTERLHEP